MADNKSPEERSNNMSKIRSCGTKPEEYIRKKLFARGYRYRKNVPQIAGHPDAWLKSYNSAVFVNGCFWHRHEGCRFTYMPKSRIEYWSSKFSRNIERDRKVRKLLTERHIRILVVWECTIKRMMKSEVMENEIINRAEAFLKSNEEYLEL